jgi:hypothetical protein
MRRHRFLAILAIASFMSAVSGSALRADYITGGSLIFNLDGNAFANGADVPYLNSFGVAYDPNQTFMEFGRHFKPAETVGVSVLGFRPEPNPPVVNFNDLRAGWVRPSSSGLAYGVNGTGPIPNPQPPGRSAVPTTFAFDPSNIEATATGAIGTIGSTSFWYANDPLIATGSIWLGWGDMTLQYSAARDNGANSGWFFDNRLLGTMTIFDTRNLSIFVQAAGTNPGIVAISGDLYVAPEFRDAFALESGLKVGTFSLRAQTVPEPASIAMMAIGAAMVLACRKRVMHAAK